jgi:hypothetical protein
MFFFSIKAKDRSDLMKTFDILTNHKKSLHLAGFVSKRETVITI